MDKSKIETIWEKVIPKGTMDSCDAGETYRSKDWPTSTSATLTMLDVSHIKTVSMTENKETPQDDFTISPTPPKTDGEKRKKLQSQYQLLGEIARGGMGVVFKGCQSSLQREIAIKKIIDDNEINRSKFLCESIVTAHLDHPNIVPVHELAENENGEAFLAMKLVGGREWKRLLHPRNDEEKKHADEYDIQGHIQILLSVCNAIAYAHSKEIVHCDLKPSNVMVGEFGEVLVMDWGIAVETGQKHRGLTVHKSMIDSPMGTPYYMPSELASGHGNEIGPWTDVYLLGGILYEILMRKPPHKGNTMTAIFAAIMGENPKFSDDIPTELQDICLKALAKDKKQRYQNVAEFSSAIKEYLKHRESLLISGQAKNTLERCLQMQNKAKNHNTVYSDFAQAVAGFDQAIKLWDGNNEASRGREEAKYAYAQIALKKEDFGLAEAQLNTMVLTSKVEALQLEVKQARDKKMRIQKTTARLKQVVFFTTFLIIVGLAVGFFLVNKAYHEANHQKEIANEQRDIANEQKEIASKQRDIANEQKEIAEKNAEEARKAYAEAEKKRQQLAIEKKKVEEQQGQISENEDEIRKQNTKIRKQNSRLTKQNVALARQKNDLLEKNQQIVKQQQLLHEQYQEIKEKHGRAVQAAKVSIRVMDKDEIQQNPAMMQNAKHLFKQLKALDMLEEIFDDEEDGSWLYGILDENIEVFTKAIQSQPNNYSAYYNRGNAYIQHGFYDKAIADFSRALDLKPDLGEAYYNRGIIYLKRKQYTTAINNFDSAIKYTPNNEQFLYYRAFALLRLNEFSKAKQDLLKCISLNDQNTQAHDKLGMIYFGEEKYTQSISSFQKVITYKPSSRNAHYYLARVYSITRNKAQALKHLSLAIQNKFSDVEDLKTNPDFKSIRNTKDFRRLVDQLLEK